MVMRNFNILRTLVLSLWLVSGLATAHAALSDPLTTIELETPVHFLAPDGSDLMVDAGTYTIEPAEEWIRLMSGERHDAVLIEAKKGTHELELTEILALSVPGTEDDSQDLHHVILLLPNGNSLESTGTYSGIRPRGLFDQAVKKVKKKAKKAHKKAKSTAKKSVSSAKSTAGKGAKHAQQHTQKSASQAKKSAAKAQNRVRKRTQQAMSSATHGLQNSRKAALQAKRNVEKTTRKAARRVRQGVNKGKKLLKGFLAPPPTDFEFPGGKFFNLFEHNRTGHAYINSYLLGFTSLFVYEPDLVLCPKGQDCWSRWKQAFTELFHKGGMKTFRFIKDPLTNTQAAVMSNDQLVVVVFRGSEQNAQDWLQVDANFPLIPAPNWGAGVRTHQGFTAAFRSVFPRIRDAIRRQNRTGPKRVWLTGHSLGGALAFLHAHALVREAGIQIQGVHTYGAPRVGNPRWNRVYTPILGAKTQRWVNNADFVTLLVHPVGTQPQQRLRYQHVGKINNIYANRRVRLNDNERSFPPLAYSTSDHNLFGYLCPIHKKLSPTQRKETLKFKKCGN